MEYNGFKYDITGSLNEAKLLEQASNELDHLISSYAPDIPLNLNSNFHLSSLLYGGTIEIEDRLPIGVYKTGAKTGQPRYKIITKQYVLPRLIEPLKGSELATDGYFRSDEDTLRNLKATGDGKRLIDKILERRGIEKLRGTYYEGIPKLIDEHHWSNALVHGQLNQCVTTTGRLSATRPNQQNMPPACKQFCTSRFT
jgi:DNA polymerase I-like protein with 3'-5' exonuclease and polymerase domains